MKKIITYILLVVFGFGQGFVCNPSLVYGQTIPSANGLLSLNLPDVGSMVSLSEPFSPAMLKGIEIYPDNPLKFNFFVDYGDQNLSPQAFKDESLKMIKYFLTSLTVPEKELWVNLSPYERNRIIPEQFGLTVMGRDLLAQDYMLKQLTSSLINPDEGLGEEFWDEVYAKAEGVEGVSELTFNTFNKIWIVPDNALIYVKDQSAFVIRNHLKVMLEEDYLAEIAAKSEDAMTVLEPKGEDEKLKSMTSQIIKKVILPAIDKEVNQGETFAPLRQVYNAMLLATWYKRSLKETLLAQVYADQNKIRGVNGDDPKVKEEIFEQYVESFKEGVFDFVREEYDSAKQDLVPRHYFSGGTTGYVSMSEIPIVEDFALLTSFEQSSLKKDFGKLEVDFLEANEANIQAMDYALSMMKNEEKELLRIPGKQKDEMKELAAQINSLYDNGKYEEKNYSLIPQLFDQILAMAEVGSERRNIILRARRQYNAKLKKILADLGEGIEDARVDRLISFSGKSGQDVLDLMAVINTAFMQGDIDRLRTAKEKLLELAQKVEGKKDRPLRVQAALQIVENRISALTPAKSPKVDVSSNGNNRLISFSGTTGQNELDLMAEINAAYFQGGIDHLRIAKEKLLELAQKVEGKKDRPRRVQEALQRVEDRIRQLSSGEFQEDDVYFAGNARLISFSGTSGKEVLNLMEAINSAFVKGDLDNLNVAKDKLEELLRKVKGTKIREGKVNDALATVVERIQLKGGGKESNVKEGSVDIIGGSKSKAKVLIGFRGISGDEVKALLEEINVAYSEGRLMFVKNKLLELQEKVSDRPERLSKVRSILEKVISEMEPEPEMPPLATVGEKVKPEVKAVSKYALPSWGRKGVTVKVNTYRRLINEAAGKNDLIGIYLLLDAVVEDEEVDEVIQNKAREEMAVVNRMVDEEIALQREKESPFLGNLSQGKFRAFESWYLNGSKAESLFQNDELIVSSFERVAQEAFELTAKQFNLAAKASQMYLVGPMRFLSNGKGDKINLVLTNEFFGAMNFEELGNFVDLYVTQLNHYINVVSPTSSLIPSAQRGIYTLRFQDDDKQIKEISLSIQMETSLDSVVDTIATQISYLNEAEGEERALLYMAAEYYLSRNEGIYTQMRDMFLVEKADSFLKDKTRLKREKAILDRTAKMDNVSREMIRQRLLKSANPFTPGMLKSNLSFSSNLTNHVLSILESNEYAFKGDQSIVPVLKQMLRHNRVIFEDNLPEPFVGYLDREDSKSVIFIDRTLQSFFESVAVKDLNDLTQKEIAVLNFLIAKLLNKTTKIIARNDPLVPSTIGKEDATSINIALVGYLTELKYLSRVPGFLKAFNLNLRLEPPIVAMYKNFMKSDEAQSGDLLDLEDVQGSVEVIKNFLEGIGYSSDNLAVDHIVQLEDFLNNVQPINFQESKNASQAFALSYGFERTGDGFGWTMRDLSIEEIQFKNDLSAKLEVMHDERVSLIIAETLVRLKGDSLLILKKHGILSDNDYKAIALLDVSLLSDDIAEKFFYMIDELEQKYSMAFIEKNLETHLLPLQEISRLRNTYLLKDNEMKILEDALNYQNVEAWIKRTRSSQQERGRLDKRHLKRHDLNSPLRGVEEKKELLKQLDTILRIVKRRTYKSKNKTISFSKFSSRFRNHAVRVAPNHGLKRGTVVFDPASGNHFRVENVVADQIVLADLFKAEVPYLGEGGEFEIVESIDASAEQELNAVTDIYEKFAAGKMHDIANFARMFGMISLRAPGEENPIKFIDEDIPFRKISSFESKGDEEQAKAVELALNDTQLTIIEGFAGSGKGKVIKEIIRQYEKRNKRIIFTTKTHQGVDNTVKDIKDTEPVLRLGNDPRKFKYGTEDVFPGTFKDEGEKRQEVIEKFKEKKKQYSPQSEVIAATVVGLAMSPYMEKNDIQADVLIIDEASTLTLSEMLVALKYLRSGGKLIVIGDTRQLPPGGLQFEGEEVVHGLSGTEQALFNKSALQWLIDQKIGDRIRLSTDYRHHSLIASFLSKVFFDGDIKVNKWEPFDGYTLRVVDLAEMAKSPDQFFDKRDETSFFNPTSIDVALDLIKDIARGKKLNPEDQLYIASYASQVSMMENILMKDYPDENDRPGSSTVDAIQGGQRYAVHYDLVRSNSKKNVGFTLNENRVYVGLSRAEKCLNIYVDKRTYQNAPLFKKMMDFYENEVLTFLPETQEDFAIPTDLKGTAMQEAILSSKEVGGINLDSSMLNLQILRDDTGKPLPVLNQPFDKIQIEGFIPVIINIVPASPLPLVVGDAENSPQLSYRSD